MIKVASLTIGSNGKELLKYSLKDMRYFLRKLNLIKLFKVRLETATSYHVYMLWQPSLKE